MATEPVLPAEDLAEARRAGIIVVGSATAGELSPAPDGHQGAPPMPPVPPPGRASGIWHPRLPGRKPKLVRGAGLPVHGQVQERLADAIATGSLAPGDRLPTEQDLAERLGVTRMTR